MPHILPMTPRSIRRTNTAFHCRFLFSFSLFSNVFQCFHFSAYRHLHNIMNCDIPSPITSFTTNDITGASDTLMQPVRQVSFRHFVFSFLDFHFFLLIGTSTQTAISPPPHVLSATPLGITAMKMGLNGLGSSSKNLEPSFGPSKASSKAGLG
jgi:hypothetical protein